MKEVFARLQALRAWMAQRDLYAYIVPTADPHGSEYLPDYWKCREWLTGFTGSAGTAVVTLSDAALWTDSRYFIQAEQQLSGTPFQLMREGEPSCPTISVWLAEHANGCRIGLCGLTCSEAEMHAWGGASAVATEDAFETLWTDRPPLPFRPVRRQSADYLATSMAQRIQAVLTEAGTASSGGLLLTDLSEIAYVLGLRGSDIDYNPVFVAYLYLRADNTGVLFTDCAVPEMSHVSVLPYSHIERLPEFIDSTPLLLPDTANASLAVMLRRAGIGFSYVPSPVPLLRAVKDECEQAGFRRAMERDGVAWVAFRRAFDEDRPTTEQEVDARLTALRAAQEGFESLSFATIAAAGQHGAIVHYEASPAEKTALPGSGFLLLDSGAQYDCGTTDITRTVPLGRLTQEERFVYTLVLKAHIGLARMRFPEGTNGLQVDTAARAPLWQAGYDFGHGTGHGVGAHLCVHEGPHQIRKDKRPCTAVPLRSGMTVTDEPGIYLQGKFGVRLENVLLVVRADDGFLQFEPLTLAPFDTAPLIVSLLTHEEIDYLNAYHNRVCRRLLPLLSDNADKQWLVQATKAI